MADKTVGDWVASMVGSLVAKLVDSSALQMVV